MYVIGTAGHVDHGKSTLVKALTGIDPDRLVEEKAREMTIDLGFAWFDLPEIADEVGVVDVPGHRDFIENMLAGVGGVDLALLVIAADEGVMPQTKEHLAILDLLQVQRGVVALTKIDMAEDEEWLDLIELDVAEALQGTVLADAPIVRVSAHTGAGIDALKQTLATQLQAADPRADLGQPKLPIDRVFSLTGFGTVVTGTLVGGSLRIGDELLIQPEGRTVRIRGLQTHKTKRDVARPGSRVAVNLTGVDRDEVVRGNVLATANGVTSTILCDAQYTHLADADAPLKHNMEVKFFVGAAETVARVRVLGEENIGAGETGWIQLALRDSLPLARGDRFILRRPSPATTIGGGTILDPTPGRKHRRFKPEVTQRLETLSKGSPAELLLQTLMRLNPISVFELYKKAGVDNEQGAALFAELEADGLVRKEGKQAVTMGLWGRWQDDVLAQVVAFHKNSPLRLGMSREEVRSRLKLPAGLFTALIDEMLAAESVATEGGLIRAHGHSVTFSEAQEKKISWQMKQFAQAGVSSPSVKDVKSAVSDDVYFSLVDLGRLCPISQDVVYDKERYDSIITSIKVYLQEKGSITAGDVRDLLSTSRKYAIALLEHMDAIKMTKRVGDTRQLL